MRDAWVTAANAATLARIAAIPGILALLAAPGTVARLGAAALYLLAALTDVLDGHLARRGGDRQGGVQQSGAGGGEDQSASPAGLGALLDLTADKLLVAVVLIELAGRQLAPPWVAMVIVARELTVAGLRAYAGINGVVVTARALGKLKMVVCSLAIPAAMLEVPAAPWLLALAAGITVVSAWPYFLAGVTLPGRDGGAAGPAP